MYLIIVWIITFLFVFEEKEPWQQAEESYPNIAGDRTVWLLRLIGEIPPGFGIIVDEGFDIPIYQDIEVFVHQQEIEVDLLFELGNIVNEYLWNP